MPVVPFLAWNTLAAVPKTVGLMALGWFAGDAWRQIELWLGRWTWLVLALIVAGVAIWWFRRCQCLQS
jgi:membrane protein DedA with SNARE-associated domain